MCVCVSVCVSYYIDDDNRIVLQPVASCQSDYINASYIDVCVCVIVNEQNIHSLPFQYLIVLSTYIQQGLTAKHKYIACQGT